jgi:hypothetical protein
MLPLARLIEPLFVSRFNLRRFRIDPGGRSRFSARLGNLIKVEMGWGGLIGLLLAGLVFFVDPIGLYASGHSKALVSVFYITDRQANPGGSPAFTTEGSPTEEMSYGQPKFQSPGATATLSGTSTPPLYCHGQKQPLACGGWTKHRSTTR